MLQTLFFEKHNWYFENEIVLKALIKRKEATLRIKVKTKFSIYSPNKKFLPMSTNLLVNEFKRYLNPTKSSQCNDSNVLQHICCNSNRRRGWKNGTVVRSLVALPEDRFYSQHLHERSQLPVTPVSRGSDPLFWPPRCWAHLVHIYTCRQTLI